MLIVLVEAQLIGPAGDRVISRLVPFHPTKPAMLVCVGSHGFTAYAHFQTARLLAMLQLEQLYFKEIDLSCAAEHDPPF